MSRKLLESLHIKLTMVEGVLNNSRSFIREAIVKAIPLNYGIKGSRRTSDKEWRIMMI
jgi:hypothetical protein